MPGSDTRETSCFKIKHIAPITNVEGATNSGDSSQDASNNHNDEPFTAAAQNADRHRKRKNKRKRETSPEF